MSLLTMIGKLGLDTTQFDTGIERAKKNSKSFADKVERDFTNKITKSVFGATAVLGLFSKVLNDLEQRGVKSARTGGTEGTSGAKNVGAIWQMAGLMYDQILEKISENARFQVVGGAGQAMGFESQALREAELEHKTDRLGVSKSRAERRAGNARAAMASDRESKQADEALLRSKLDRINERASDIEHETWLQEGGGKGATKALNEMREYNKRQVELLKQLVERTGGKGFDLIP